jgi:hypothetical protein
MIPPTLQPNYNPALPHWNHERSLPCLLADAHPVFRAGLQSLLTSLPDFLLVAEASTGHETLSLTAKLKPNVVVLDVDLWMSSELLENKVYTSLL